MQLEDARAADPKTCRVLLPIHVLSEAAAEVADLHLPIEAGLMMHRFV